MTDPKEQPQISTLATNILRLRRQFQEAWGDKRRKWRALAKIRDGSYTDEYRRIPWKTRYKSNQGLVQLEHQKAFLLQQVPTARAISDSEQETVEGLPDVANAAIDVIAAEIDFNTLYKLGIDDMQVYGPMIYKIYMDGPRKFKVSLVNPLNLYPDPLAESLSECEVVIEDMLLPLSAARRRWPDKTRELNRAAAGGAGGTSMLLGQPPQYLYETPNDYDKKVGEMGDTQLREVNTPVLFHEVFFKDPATVEVYEEAFEPTGELYADGTPKMRRVEKAKIGRKYKNGRRVIITASGELIEDKDNYDALGKFPYIMAGGHEAAHEFWPTSDLEIMAPTIILLDELTSNIADAAKFTAYPSFAVDPQAMPSRDYLVVRPCQIYPVKNPNYTFKAIQPAPMHDSVIRLHGILNYNLRLGMNAPEEQMGFRPRGDVTGRSIEAMSQLASIQPGMKYANLSRATNELFSRLYEYAKKYWRVKKLTVNTQANDMAARRVMSEPQDPAKQNKMGTITQTWEPEKMKNSTVRIIVEPGTGMPTDPNQEFASLFQVFQLLLSITQDPQLTAKLIPPSYLVSQTGLRNKQMILKRMMEAEFEGARKAGIEEGMADALRKGQLNDVIAMLHSQAQGAPQQ